MTTSSEPRVVRPAAVRHHGVAGNSRLTTMIGAVLIAMFAVQGLTILQMGQLLWLHLFLGVVLAVLVAVKLTSAGYRMTSYYAGREAYVREGPPHIALRLLAAPFVLLTIGIFASGGTLLLVGPSVRQPVLLIHQVCFYAWLGCFAAHLLGHAKDVLRVLRVEFGTGARRVRVAGRRARFGVIAGALTVGLVIAALLIPNFSAWTSHHGDDGRPGPAPASLRAR